MLSLATAVDVAVGRGASVVPYHWPDAGAAAYARRVGALLASREGARSAARRSRSPRPPCRRAADIDLALRLDASGAAPVLRDGAFTAWSGPIS